MQQKKRCPSREGHLGVVQDGEKFLLLGLRVALRRGVVLFAVDIARRVVLLPVDLLLFARGQRPAIGLAVLGDLLVDALLLFFELGGFARRELPALNALRNSVLLIFTAPPHFVVAVVRSVSVVLVVVNLLCEL